MGKKIPKQLPQKITIKRDESKPESMELVAKAILDIAEAVTTMRERGKDKLIVLLLHDMTGVTKRDIQNILDAAPNIARTYLRDGGR